VAPATAQVDSTPIARWPTSRALVRYKFPNGTHVTEAAPWVPEEHGCARRRAPADRFAGSGHACPVRSGSRGRSRSGLAAPAKAHAAASSFAIAGRRISAIYSRHLVGEYVVHGASLCWSWVARCRWDSLDHSMPASIDGVARWRPGCAERRGSSTVTWASSRAEPSDDTAGGTLDLEDSTSWSRRDAATYGRCLAVPLRTRTHSERCCVSLDQVVGEANLKRWFETGFRPCRQRRRFGDTSASWWPSASPRSFMDSSCRQRRARGSQGQAIQRSSGAFSWTGSTASASWSRLSPSSRWRIRSSVTGWRRRESPGTTRWRFAIGSGG